MSGESLDRSQHTLTALCAGAARLPECVAALRTATVEKANLNFSYDLDEIITEAVPPEFEIDMGERTEL